LIIASLQKNSMRKKLFHTHTIKRLFKSVGCKRISKEAVEEFKKILIEYATKLAQESILLAKHAKRKTVKEEDVELASKKRFILD